MKFYHGTKNKDLKELNLEHYSGKIYITDSYYMAFLYASSPARFWDYNKEQDKVVFREVCHDHFKKQFQGKECYIFSCNVEEYEKAESNRSGHAFITNKPVILNQPPEYIPDAYTKLMQMAERGEVLLERWEDMTPEVQQSRVNSVLKVYTPEIMRNEKEKFPEVYEIFIKLLPKLKLKDEK